MDPEKLEHSARRSHADDRWQGETDRNKDRYCDRDPQVDSRKRKHGDRHDRSDGAQFKPEHHSDSSDTERRRYRRDRHGLAEDRKHERDSDYHSHQTRKRRVDDNQERSANGRRRSPKREEGTRKRRDRDDDARNGLSPIRHSKRKEESGRDVARADESNNHKRKTTVADQNGDDNAAAVKQNKRFLGSLANDSIDDKLQGRSGGVYIPPFKLAQMMKDIEDKSGAEYQRLTWDALRKSINGLVNKVNASNIKNILPELFAENLIRGRGLFARSCMKSQMASPTFTHVFAGLVAVVNTKFPELGELLLKRIILQFRRGLKRNDKPLLLAAVKFIAHLVNQQVAHEIVALEVLMVLLENPTDDSVEVAVGFVKECGAILQDLAPQGLHSIFERFRGILHEGEIDKRVQFMIEGLFAIRKANFQGHQAILPELDLVEREDQFTHEISLSDDLNAEMGLDIFKADPNFSENEKKYEAIKRDILGEELDDDGEEDDRDSNASSEEDDDDEDEAELQMMKIKDETETDLVNLRRTIYLTIMSSVDFEEAGHKLLKIKLEQGQEMELCIMLLECCSQERTYLRYYGLLGQRFCMINKVYQENFDDCFAKQYSMIHRLETNKLRNVGKFFAHLLGTDALPWNVLAYIRLTEEDTTSSSRIFIKILFQELSEHLGLRMLNERLNDPLMQDFFDGIFPKDNPKNTRFAINFFTSIGLGGITDSLREYLKNMPRLIMQQQKPLKSETEETESSETAESESDSGSSDSDSESSGSESSPKKKSTVMMRERH